MYEGNPLEPAKFVWAALLHFRNNLPIVWGTMKAVIRPALSLNIFAILIAILPPILYGDEFTIPLSTGGSIVLKDIQFIRHDQFNIDEPVLTFTIVDNSSAPWHDTDLHFDMGGVCSGEIQQWATPYQLFPSSVAYAKNYGHNVVEFVVKPLIGKLQGCYSTTVRVRIGSEPMEPLNLRDDIERVKLAREAEASSKAAAEAEQKRLAVEQEAKRKEDQAKRLEEWKQRDEAEAAAQAARQQKAAADRKKKAAEDAAAYAKRKAVQEAAEAAERKRIKDACGIIYKSTADKRAADLTVREEQQVRACQSLGLYPPQ